MTRSPRKSDSLNGLTPIPQPIHCAATNDGGGAVDELDQLAINHFQETLASIALAVAARKVAEEHTGGEVECEP